MVICCRWYAGDLREGGVEEGLDGERFGDGAAGVSAGLSVGAVVAVTSNGSVMKQAGDRRRRLWTV